MARKTLYYFLINITIEIHIFDVNNFLFRGMIMQLKIYKYADCIFYFTELMKIGKASIINGQYDKS